MNIARYEDEDARIRCECKQEQQLSAGLSDQWFLDCLRERSKPADVGHGAPASRSAASPASIAKPYSDKYFIAEDHDREPRLISPPKHNLYRRFSLELCAAPRCKQALTIRSNGEISSCAVEWESEPLADCEFMPTLLDKSCRRVGVLRWERGAFVVAAAGKLAQATFDLRAAAAKTAPPSNFCVASGTLRGCYGILGYLPIDLATIPDPECEPVEDLAGDDR